MDERWVELENRIPLQALLGYLNFSQGKPDARFQKQHSDSFGYLVEQGAANPWIVFREVISAKLDELQAAGLSAFRDSTQAAAVVDLVFSGLLPAYRRHHADLLFHWTDWELFQPFFVARAFEAVLSQGSPWQDKNRILAGALHQLNDYVGHRPIAILETRPKAEPYDHERVRPIPLSLRGAGVAWGRYQELLSKALEIVVSVPAGILSEANFDPELLDELALDPRAYDHAHPANRRPNYIFGEWDPHHLDSEGRYRRYVIRQITLDALLDRLAHAGDLPREEILFEAAAVLIGTLLMATGISGSSPDAHDSTTTLSSLMPRIAHYRDAYYAQLLENVSGAHGQRLRQEAVATRQPFGAGRQHLNHYLARHRALQLQQRQLAVLFALMGYAEASQQAAALIPAASVRLYSEILGRLTTGQLALDRAELGQAAEALPPVEDLLQRGIACGAFADPWNILGFQGLYPLFAAREDSLRDTRIDELVQIVEATFHLHSRLIGESAASGNRALVESTLTSLRRMAGWWDQFASVEVADVRRVHGGETVVSAEHVAKALGRWHARGEAAADLAFWRNHLEGFQSAKAFALVVDALLRKEDYRAAMGLLMAWLSRADDIPLEEGEHSFFTLALRWMLGCTAERAGADTGTVPATADPARGRVQARKFFQHLEANAEDLWLVPALELESADEEEDDEEEDAEDSPYEAAYEGMTYRDSTDDDGEGAVIDGAGPEEPFELEMEAEYLVERLRFLSTVARLWQIAARAWTDHAALDEEGRGFLASALAVARDHRDRLHELLAILNVQPIPEPLGSYDSFVEFDRQRSVKDQLLETAINTCLDHEVAVAALQIASQVSDTSILEQARLQSEWQTQFLGLERAILAGDAATVRDLLMTFLTPFSKEPLLFTALADGGDPTQIVRVRYAQVILRGLVTALPRLGLLRETYLVLKTAHAMEQAHPPRGRGVTEFNFLFQSGYQAVVEAVVGSSDAQVSTPERDQRIIDLLETMTRHFLSLWIEHSQTLMLSSLEVATRPEEWEAMRDFIKRYGRDLFHARFMTLANLRGILHRGLAGYLDYLRENPDPLHPIRLINDLDIRVRRDQVEAWLRSILQALVENYEEYKDYNTTTAQSDYGDNVHLLLDFLRLKVSYDRHGWRLRPLLLAHEVLVRCHRPDLATSWQEGFVRLTGDLADTYVEKLRELEQSHGMHLGTVADRIRERFIKPLQLDRLCALVEPAMVEARQSGGGHAFANLQKELRPLTEQPTGVGLDVPHWLRRLEAEVHRVATSHASQANQADHLARVPRLTLTLDQVQQQIETWEDS